MGFLGGESPTFLVRARVLGGLEISGARGCFCLDNSAFIINTLSLNSLGGDVMDNKKLSISSPYPYFENGRLQKRPESHLHRPLKMCRLTSCFASLEFSSAVGVLFACDLIGQLSSWLNI